MALKDGKRSAKGLSFSAVIPVLVVPEGTLWRCEYDFDGKRVMQPTTTDRVQVFFGKECKYNAVLEYQPQYVLSHLEIVTPAGVDDLMSKLTNFDAIMSDDKAAELFAELKDQSQSQQESDDEDDSDI